MIRCATHVMGGRPEQLMDLGVFVEDEPDNVLLNMHKLAQQLDTGDGVLILCDILGATPCNIASRLVQTNQIACVTGVSLPMLVKTLTYRNESLSVAVEKALSGGKDGVTAIPAGTRHAT